MTAVVLTEDKIVQLRRPAVPESGLTWQKLDWTIRNGRRSGLAQFGGCAIIGYV